jgi:hypothetical protein
MWTLKELYAKSMAELHAPYVGDEESKGVSLASKLSVPFPNDFPAPFVSASKEKVPVPPMPNAAQSKPFRLNAAQIPRPDALNRFPFADDGEASSFLLQQPPGPNFLDFGVPLRKRLAAKVYAECCAGAAVMKVADIPRALTMLGLRVDPELAKGFAGSFAVQGVSLGQWQG